MGALAGCSRNADSTQRIFNNNSEYRNRDYNYLSEKELKENIEDANADIEGFGDIKMSNALPISAHYEYQTETGDYIVQLGASKFLIEGKTGKLLTSGFHTIRKDTNGIIVAYGARKRKGAAPLNYKDKELTSTPTLESWIRKEFEERKDGLYVKGWK